MKEGRPFKFENVEIMQQYIDEYFLQTPEDELTITGLALALDTTRETLMDYQGRAEFSDTVKRAKLRIHNAYEKDLRRKGRAGDIFALKNFGWTDQRHVDVNASVTKMPSVMIGETPLEIEIGDPSPSDSSDT